MGTLFSKRLNHFPRLLYWCDASSSMVREDEARFMYAFWATASGQSILLCALA